MDALRFETTIIHWRGPAPYFYAPLPPAQASRVADIASLVSYGWGMIPVEAGINGVRFTTAMFRKNGTYYLPLKDRVRREAGITAGDTVMVELAIQPPKAPE